MLQLRAFLSRSTERNSNTTRTQVAIQPMAVAQIGCLPVSANAETSTETATIPRISRRSVATGS
ncbi:Uncharacterised protein [Mycobacteroides abscessus subsp. abscessus]|nr:Uncharacterised protein [Mycobacteroides abscessus subsp. abscessus]